MLPWKRIAAPFATGPDRAEHDDPIVVRRRYERHRWSVFLSVTLGYGLFYVCRINFAIVKKPLLDAGIFDAQQLGMVGSAMLGVYAFGRFANGILADRAHIGRFMGAALFVSALINLLLGNTVLFPVFMVLWALNGWCQSVGSAPSVVALCHWFSRRERGTRYGIWSIAHSLGEGLSFVVTSVLVARFGWRWGFWGPGLLGIAAGLTLMHTISDRPETYGLPPAWRYRNDQAESTSTAFVRAHQKLALRSPGVWLLALASACMYVTRYGINNWGILYLQEAKHYSLVGAGQVLVAYPVAGFFGSSTSGFVSDRWFGSRRNLLALVYGLVECAALAGLWLIPPGHAWLDAATLAAFGFALGGLLVFLGGLMAVDLVPQRATGAAMGLVGLVSYLGAAVQDAVSGFLLERSTAVSGGVASRSYDGVFAFWLGASLLSILLSLGVRLLPRGSDEFSAPATASRA